VRIPHRGRVGRGAASRGADEVRLENVTVRNWRAVVRLRLAPEQKDLVASNLYSIAQSKFDPNAHPRAVYAGKELVGFLMYNVWETEEKIREASIYRFMIDVKNQGKGYGRVALARALDEIKATPGVKKVSICYMLENAVAKKFYGSFGFVEVGRDEDGEIEAELTL
jgi:diamine N-acetyltransferase